MDALSISVYSRWVLKLIRRHTVTELRDMSRQRAMGKPGSHRWTPDLMAHWHTGLLSPLDPLLAVSMLEKTPKRWPEPNRNSFFLLMQSCQQVAIKFGEVSKQRSLLSNTGQQHSGLRLQSAILNLSWSKRQQQCAQGLKNHGQMGAMRRPTRKDSHQSFLLG